MSKDVSNRVFASWVRRGVAALIEEKDPASGPWLAPATFDRIVNLNKDGVAALQITGARLPVLGPGAVVGLVPNSVLRTDPRDGATGVEDNYLVQIEFSRADLPWMFTPAAPNDANRLRPWLVLIVLDASTVQLEPGMPLPRVSVNVSDLPDLDDSWGWAHAQVTVDTAAADPPGNSAAEDAVEKTAVAMAAAGLVPASGPSAISRLLCPRHLQRNKTYLACVVPATEPGRLAGLGGLPDPGPAIAQAWIASSRQDVVLPVYYSWRFSTGDDGDFKSLVERLHGVSPTEVTGFGTRTVDMSSPWQHADVPPGPQATVGLGGALGTGVELPLSDAAQAVFKPRLTRLLNFPASQQPADAAADPTLSAVAPPIYAGRHAGATTVTDDAGWLGSLNLDPRRRIAAAFGTQYVQENQEFLMAQAWNQLGAVQEANRLQALAELAAEVGDRMHRRHIAGLSFSKMVAIASPARTRVLMSPVQTLHTRVMASPMPAGAATTAFNRFTRAQGPLGRRTINIQKPPAVIERGLLGTLTLGALRQDGIATLTPLTPPAVTDSTAGLVSRSLQAVAAIEKAIPAQSPALLQAINSVPRAVLQNPRVLALGLPILRLLQAPAAKPADPNAVVGGLTFTLAASLMPSSGIYRRFQDRVQIPDGLGAGKAARVMACPQFTVPLAMDLRYTHPDWLLPGLGNFPDNRVTLLEADGAFVESFLAGANHEMNREFLWRGYPTDQRGTPFRYFWPRPDRVPDIPPITNWPLKTPLGKNGTMPEKENMVVLLVRGELLHRYPRLIAHAAKGNVNGQTITLDGDEQAWVPPDFALRLDDRTTAFAYNLSEDAIRSGNQQPGGYFFVFAEPITGPRFNFDGAPGDPPIAGEKLLSWTDLDWARVPQPRGFAFAGGNLATPPPPFKNFHQPAGWNRDAADIARIAFAQPFRIGFHADQLLPPRKVPPGV